MLFSTQSSKMCFNMYKSCHKLGNAKIGWQSDLHDKMNLNLMVDDGASSHKID